MPHHFLKLISPLVLLIVEMRHENGRSPGPNPSPVIGGNFGLMNKYKNIFDGQLPQKTEKDNVEKQFTESLTIPVHFTKENQKLLEEMVYFDDNPNIYSHQYSELEHVTRKEKQRNQKRSLYIQTRKMFAGGKTEPMSFKVKKEVKERNERLWDLFLGRVY